MSQETVAKTSPVIKRLTGADLDATRAFLRKQCFVKGKGFWSQYAGQEMVSCTTTAICVYALSETGPLTLREKDEFQRVLLAFRRNSPTDQDASRKWRLELPRRRWRPSAADLHALPDTRPRTVPPPPWRPRRQGACWCVGVS